MKYSIIFLIAISNLLFSCKQTSKTENTSHDITVNTTDNTKTGHTKSTDASPGSTAGLSKLISLEDAEKILGEPAMITDSTVSGHQTIDIYKTAYTTKAGNADEKGNLYLLIERYKHSQDAMTKYAFIKASNENSGGFKELKDLGDEAYFHSDNENFYFTMVRKNTSLLTMKVNKITKKTSLDAFNEVARKITSNM